MRSLLLGLVTALSLTLAAQAAEPACRLQKVAELPVTLAGLIPRVPVRINVRKAVLTADSGAFFSMIGAGSIPRLGMRPGATPHGLRVKGVGGARSVRVYVADRFELAGGALTNVDFLVADTMFGRADGVLGQNVLGVFDVEYDLAGGAIRLFKPQGCEAARLAYWAKDEPVNVIDVRPATPLEPHILAQGTVNGRPVEMMFDTGATRSMLKLSTARRLGFRPEGPGVTSAGVTSGVGAGELQTWSAPFDEFALGDETIRNTRLLVAPIPFSRADMVLGADFFLSHRVLVSRSQNRIYFTYEGGPVFRLDAPAAAEAGAAR